MHINMYEYYTYKMARDLKTKTSTKRTDYIISSEGLQEIVPFI